MKNPTIEEVRVKVAVCYYPTGKKVNDEDLLENVQDVGVFEAVEQQMYGASMLDHGFIIFQANREPTVDEKKAMIDSVKESLKYLKV